MRKAIVIVALAAALGGCGEVIRLQTIPPLIPMSDAVERLEKAECCDTRQSLKLDELTTKNRYQTFRIGSPGDRAMSVAGKRTFYKAFRVPQETGPIDFELLSHGVGGQIFAPIVLVLNEDFSVSRGSSLHQLQYTGENKLWREPASYEIRFRIDPIRSPRERYILVTTDPRIATMYFEFSRVPAPNTTLYYPQGMSASPPTAEKIPAVRASPVGTIEIQYTTDPFSRAFDRFLAF